MPAVVAVAIMTPASGKDAAFLEHLRALGDVSENEPGTRDYRIIRLDGEQPRFLVFEVFDGRDAYQAHEDNPEVAPLAAAMTGILAGAEILTGEVVHPAP